MIFSNIKYENKDLNHLDYFKKFKDFVLNNDLSKFEKGVHEIDGQDFFLNIVEYDSKDEEERFWEAHRKYLDIHFMIHGCERIKLSFIDNMKIKDYDEENDFLSFENGEINSHFDLYPGDFLICYKEDVHMTALKIKNKESVKKGIFKIRII